MVAEKLNIPGTAVEEGVVRDGNLFFAHGAARSQLVIKKKKKKKRKEKKKIIKFSLQLEEQRQGGKSR